MLRTLRTKWNSTASNESSAASNQLVWQEHESSQKEDVLEKRGKLFINLEPFAFRKVLKYLEYFLPVASNFPIKRK